jgi:Single-strand binding protein family
MASDNQTVIVGNLVDDPELRFTSNGTPVSNLRVAVTQRVLGAAPGATARRRSSGSTLGGRTLLTSPSRCTRATGWWCWDG